MSHTNHNRNLYGFLFYVGTSTKCLFLCLVHSHNHKGEHNTNTRSQAQAQAQGHKHKHKHKSQSQAQAQVTITSTKVTNATQRSQLSQHFIITKYNLFALRRMPVTSMWSERWGLPVGLVLKVLYLYYRAI